MKQLIGVDIGSFTFAPGVAGAGTITISGLSTLTLDQFLLITNVTDQTIIYNFADTALGGTLAGAVLTLETDTNSMSAGDDLQIFIETEIADVTATHVRITDERLGIGKGHFANVSPDDFLRVERFGSLMMNEVFEDGSIDTTDRWTETIVTGGSSSFSDSNLFMTVTTASGASIEYLFNQDIINVSSTLSRYLTAVKFGTEQTNNIKEWGIINQAGTDGLFYRLDGSTLFFVEKKSGVETTTDISTSKPTDGKFHVYDIEFGGNARYLAHIDDPLVASKSLTNAPITSSKKYSPFWKHSNSALLAGAASDLETVGCVIVDQSGTAIAIQGQDENSIFRTVRVTLDRRLLVSQEAPGAPPGTTQIVQTAFSSINNTADTLFTITNSKTLTIQRLSAGAEVTTEGSIIELFEDPNGDLSVLNVIIVIFASGNSDQNDLSIDFVGDGTRRILLRRRPFGGGFREIFGRWVGFER